MPGLPDNLIDLVVARADELARAGTPVADAVAVLRETTHDGVVVRLARARCESRPGVGAPRSLALLRAAEAGS